MSEVHPLHQLWQQSLPKQSLTSKVILETAKGEWVIVKNPHRRSWQLPGGGVDQHETPRSAAKREVLEETNIEIGEPQLLLIDSIVTRGEHGDGLMFYWKAQVDTAALARIKIQAGELHDYQILPAAEAIALLGDDVQRRLAAYFALSEEQQSAVVYLEEGGMPEEMDADA